MKVIVAGLPKTGTKSMAAAFNDLGYKVCDGMDHHHFHMGKWDRIFHEGPKTKYFKEMYEDYDVVSDVPACAYWQEIHKAFPEAKIIFSERPSEDDWFKSWENQIRSCNAILFSLMWILSPTFNKFYAHAVMMLELITGSPFKRHWFKPAEDDERLIRLWYRRHNAHVLHNALKDKMLIYNVKDGWKPLCNFLDVPVPTTPFPHCNKKGEIVDQMIATHPMFQKIKLEMLLSSLCFLSVVVIVSLLL